MKKRSVVLRIAVLLCSIGLVGAYVVGRAAGWIGQQPQPAPTVTDSAAAAEPAPQQSNEYFSTSKSGPVLKPDQVPTVLPGSKSLVIDPLPPKKRESTEKSEYKFPVQPPTSPK